jgi:5'-deoxynucleotidase YfbR-like HD superfamily hydrolase
MTIDEYTEERIGADVSKLRQLYKLKSVIRSNITRSTDDCTESVAEHVFGMHILAGYFLPLEDPAGDWDKSLIYELITTHDLEETITGDVVGWEKTAANRREEKQALTTIVSEAPLHMQEWLRHNFTLYEEQSKREAQFVKAIDKIEPHVQFFDEQKKWIFEENKITAEKAMSIKEPYVNGFPFIRKCNEYIHKMMLKEGYYYQK